MRDEIRAKGLELGADAVGFAAIDDYASVRARNPRTILPTVRSMVVLGYRELDGPIESDNARASFAARMGTMELGTRNNYLLARQIEDRCRVKATPVPFSYPLDMGSEARGLIGDISLRHAAVAAGLGVLGRHNLVIHPRFGTRIVFTAILTELDLGSDQPVDDELCDRCNLCVEACPAGALDEEGKTDALRCLRTSQPYGIGGTVRYLRKFLEANPQEKRELLKDPTLLQIYQSQFIGFHYYCFSCMAACPACLGG